MDKTELFAESKVSNCAMCVLKAFEKIVPLQRNRKLDFIV